MPIREELRGSAAKAARRVARRQWKDLLLAYRRMRRRRRANSLHDFRVALRRLRSTLRAFRPALAPPRGLRRGLRRLARATDESRNLEIWQKWVAAEANPLTTRQRQGVSWLQTGLRTQRRRADSRMREQITKRLAGLRGDLAELLSDPTRHSTRSAKTGTAVKRALRRGTAELAQKLARVHSMQDRTAAHSARIAAKQVRYLLEPFADELAGAQAHLEQLADLQFILGEVHDAHVFADELRRALVEAGEGRLLPWPSADGSPRQAPPSGARAGLLALARRLGRAGELRFARLLEYRRQGKAARLLNGLGKLGGARRRRNRGGRI
jgi:CHAD domain-containing protein